MVDAEDERHSPSIGCAPVKEQPSPPPLALLDAPHVDGPPQAEPPTDIPTSRQASENSDLPEVRSQAEPVQEPSPRNDVSGMLPEEAPREPGSCHSYSATTA